MSSINNIYSICREQQKKRGKLSKNSKGDDDVNELTPNLVQELIKRLDTSAEVIEDLKAVLDSVQIDFDV